jgi:large subunit ribosomal protein L47
LWKRDNNKNRGLSILRSTGLRKRQTLSVKRWLKEIPKPVTLQKPLTGDEEHGLWEFFHEKKSLRTPDEMQQHGTLFMVWYEGAKTRCLFGN